MYEYHGVILHELWYGKITIDIFYVSKMMEICQQVYDFYNKSYHWWCDFT